MGAPAARLLLHPSLNRASANLQLARQKKEPAKPASIESAPTRRVRGPDGRQRTATKTAQENNVCTWRRALAGWLVLFFALFEERIPRTVLGTGLARTGRTRFTAVLYFCNLPRIRKLDDK